MAKCPDPFCDGDCTPDPNAIPVIPPPCCHAPHLCGGPHEDCYEPPGGYHQQPSAKAEAVADIRRPPPDFTVERDATGKAVKLTPVTDDDPDHPPCYRDPTRCHFPAGPCDC